MYLPKNIYPPAARLAAFIVISSLMIRLWMWIGAIASRCFYYLCDNNIRLAC